VTDSIPEAPPTFQALIEKALAKDPSQRFQTGEELYRMLGTSKHQLHKAMAQTDTGSQ